MEKFSNRKTKYFKQYQQSLNGKKNVQSESKYKKYHIFWRKK